jgi:hypothetical protein
MISSASTRSGWTRWKASDMYPPSERPPITADVAPTWSSSAAMSPTVACSE